MPARVSAVLAACRSSNAGKNGPRGQLPGPPPRPGCPWIARWGNLVLDPPTAAGYRKHRVIRSRHAQQAGRTVPRLLVIKGADEGKQFELAGPHIGVGREAGNDVRLHDT